MGDTGIEVFQETLHSRGEVLFETSNEIISQGSCHCR